MKAGEERNDPDDLSVRDRRRLTPEGELRPDFEEAEPEPEAGDGGIALSETVPLAHLEEAEQRAVDAERGLAEFREAFQRYREEHDAIRARLERDLDARVRAAVGGAFEGLLGALDNLDLALEYADESPLARGMLMVREQIFDGLRAAGLESIDVLGKPFDPEVAEAVQLVEVDDESRAKIVLEQMRRGYRLGDQVLRPAQVKVGTLGEGGGAAGED
jgi:molecular chaperone GrpE